MLSKTIKEMHDIARSFGGKCLSESYVNSKTKLLWECDNGHKWESSYANVLDKEIPCPKCRGRNAFDLDLCNEIAKERNGKCLSKEYYGGRVKLKWQCKEEHFWEATPYAVILNKSWCRKCSFTKMAEERRFSIDIAKEIAREKGGELLTKEYKNSDTKMEWKCSNGHKFRNDLYHIRQRDQWCPKCVGKNITIEEVKEFALKRGGKCLSDQYVNTETKMLWECSTGHQWKAHFNGMKSGKWCPRCSTSIGEEICREYFKIIFNSDFPSAYPHWLKNEYGEQLELDGYCEKLQIAFEHQGRQHYEHVEYFHQTTSNLEKTQKHDKLKHELCNKNGVKLVIVPHILNILGIDRVEEFLKEEFKKQNIEFSCFNDLKINIDKLYNKQEIKKYREIAQSKGGECLSEQYINAHHKLKWQCQEGHIWEAAPFTIKKGHWCPDCQGRNKTIEEIQKIALAKGGKLISKTYQNNRDKLTWECAKGHKWNAPLSSIQPRKNNKGSWCPECHGTPKKSIKEMRFIAESRGGKCVSTEYCGVNRKLTWECDKGHSWETTPSAIINNNTWCPICSRIKANRNRVKYTIQDMRDIAKEKEGDCLSEEYFSFSIHLSWQCKYWHEWKATPKNILKGRWCPECAKKKRIETRKKSKKNGLTKECT